MQTSPEKSTAVWNGDAVVATGFARATHNICDRLQARWQTPVLGINYHGDPHAYPYRIYPAALGGDAWGIGRIDEILNRERPDLLVVQNDPWNVADYIGPWAHQIPVVAFMPVDGKNVKGKPLNGLALAIFYTEFARREAIKGGYRGPSAVVPLGINRDIYYPGDRAAARDRLGITRDLPADVFIVGNVNRNQPRKRIDLTIKYFADWVNTHDADDAFLLLHMAPTGDRGWDVEQLCEYYGVKDRLIKTSTNLELGVGVSEQTLRHIYLAQDVTMTTTLGEGFGLTTLESMGCGVPNLVPDWSALGDWADAAVRIPCTGVSHTPNDVNVQGGVMDEEAAIAALDRLYSDPVHRASVAAASRELADRPRYRWDAIAADFGALLDAVKDGRVADRAMPEVAGAEAAA